MNQFARRDLVRGAAAAAVAGPAGAAVPPANPACAAETVSLDGPWEFRTGGETRWRQVEVPHTWQVMPGLEEYMGEAWYRRRFYAPARWRSACVRVEFQAVFHSAEVTVNGRAVGRHVGKGYTPFTLALGGALRFGADNEILVKVDNSFDQAMVPRGKSSDWAHDGGIYRPVALLVTSAVFVESVAVDTGFASPAGPATVRITAVVRNTGGQPWSGPVSATVEDKRAEITVAVAPNGAAAATLRLEIPQPRLWHFDHPHLYDLQVAAGGHSHTLSFGIRKFEVRDSAFWLNGERVRLAGVERMAGSHPRFGMAEPLAWLDHDHRDLKELNCVFTRVHWPQDLRLLDWCDRHGILLQLEVPAWGGRTFDDGSADPPADVLRNSLEQLRELVTSARNHPSVVAWGLCNEIGGQREVAHRYVRALYDEARRLDPHRPCTYASNSLTKTPERDAVGMLDFISWNEYYESWYKGTPADMRRNLQEIIRAFPGKPVVISEYGYCACTADRPEDDRRRVSILREHNRIFREFPAVGGLIFFCYNDYRTHIGDKGRGALKQRVHGVVDLYGARKPSFDALREESSPVASVSVEGSPPSLRVTVETRATVPGYALAGYFVRATGYGEGDIPLEEVDVPLPSLNPGARAAVDVQLRETALRRVRIDVMRPTGYSAATAAWKA